MMCLELFFVWKFLSVPILFLLALLLLNYRFPQKCFKILSFCFLSGMVIFLFRFSLDSIGGNVAIPFYDKVEMLILFLVSVGLTGVFIKRNREKLPWMEIQKAIGILMAYTVVVAIYNFVVQSSVFNTQVWLMIIPIQSFMQITYLLIQNDLFCAIPIYGWVIAFFLPLCFLLLGKSSEQDEEDTDSQ